MIVKREDNEIVVKFSVGTNAAKIQSILDCLRYLELTSKSEATQKDLNALLKKAKKERFNKIKKEIGLDENNS